MLFTKKKKKIEDKVNFNKWMPITGEMKIFKKIFKKIFRTGTEIDLYTEASNLNWGGCLNEQITNSRWLTIKKTFAC